MNKIITTILCAATLCGCRTKPVSPDQSWSDYASYYSSAGGKAVPFSGTADVRRVSSEQLEQTVEGLKSQGHVVIGNFKIADGTEITQPAVQALAAKLNASTVVMSVATKSSLRSATHNPALGIVGVDNTQALRMNARRPDESFAEQTIQTYDIVMLGKKQ